MKPAKRTQFLRGTDFGKTNPISPAYPARLFALLLLLSAPAFPQASALEIFENKTLTRVRAFAETFDGVLGFAAVDLAAGRTFSLHGDTVFPQASSIKIPILIEIFKAAEAGRFKLSDPVTLTREDLVGGSGKLQLALKNGPVTLTIRELITAMIETSDNVATNKSISMVGMEKVNATLDALGFRSTRLQRRMMDSAAARRGEENLSTPHEMSRLVEMLYKGKLVSPEACRDMQSIMKRVKAAMREAVPAAVEVASKPGGIDGVRCETGIVFLPNRPYVLSVMSTFVKGEQNPVGEVTRIVNQHFEQLAAANAYGSRL